MITATFYSREDRATCFSVEGHSGLSTEGEDVLCAAVTSAVRLTECVVNDILGLECAVKVKEDIPLISLRLPANLSSEQDETCQALLDGLMLYLSQLHEEYPENIIVYHQEITEV